MAAAVTVNEQPLLFSHCSSGTTHLLFHHPYNHGAGLEMSWSQKQPGCPLSRTPSQARCHLPDGTTETLWGSRHISVRLAGRPWAQEPLGVFVTVSRNAAEVPDLQLSGRLRDKHLDYKINLCKLPGRKTRKSPIYLLLFITGVSFTNQQSFATIT